jgi:hypothetical protein
MRRPLALALAACALFAGRAEPQTPKQPKVAPGPNEPDWEVILKTKFGLSMFDDLANPVRTDARAVPGRFKKAGPGPVVYTPVIALGLENTTRGGWYIPAFADEGPRTRDLWSYRLKNTAKDIETGSNLPPRLLEGSTTSFDPGDEEFGLWVANDDFKDERVLSEPRLVAALNKRLAAQPYKAMIYRYKDKATGKVVPHSYLIGWEYSTNDDFQDVVCRVDNVDLVPARTAADRPK